MRMKETLNYFGYLINKQHIYLTRSGSINTTKFGILVNNYQYFYSMVSLIVYSVFFFKMD